MQKTAGTKRNTVISICKGIAIILMVMGHADAPGIITNFIYTFHMPLFFIAAGYFFSRKYLSDPWTFISKRIKGLYVPFLKWSFFFLILHNLWFSAGLLNEQYGNWTGGVTHPYSPEDFVRRAVMIITGMGGYDEFMAGAFWFFRGLFVASILFLLLYKLLDSRTKLNPTIAVMAICLGMVAFTAIHIGVGFRITTIFNGGWRETWGIFFFGCGVLYRTYEKQILEHWAITLGYMVILCTAAWFHTSGMNNGGRFQDLWALPVTGCAGFLLVHHIASLIDRHDTSLRQVLCFIGDNTLYIFIFHILAFKPVSLIKTMIYDDVPYEAIGSHMVVHTHLDDGFFLLYTLAGVSLPLLGLLAARRIKAFFGKPQPVESA